MSSRTKKAGSTGRLGAKYGVSVRRKIGEVEKRQKKNHEIHIASGIVRETVMNLQ